MTSDAESRCQVSTTSSGLAKGPIIIAAVLSAVTVLGRVGVEASAYSIYEIQYTSEPDGRSPLESQVVDCLGGIVTHKFGGSRPKLTLQDPNFPTGWGAIQVKDWLSGAPLYHEASVGDRVMISNAFVEEFRGNTTLQCMADFDPTLTVISRGNPTPEPLQVALSEIASPIRDDSGDWHVATHGAERYEGMWLEVVNVTVTEMNLGKAADNYALQSVILSEDPMSRCWATDYMNEDAPDDYHPLVSVDRHLCRVRGILEQYTNTQEGWDYYQLVTTRAGDLSIFQTADCDGDCDVDFSDFDILAMNWQRTGCHAELNPCGGADLDGDGTVGAEDLAQFSDYWLNNALGVSHDKDGNAGLSSLHD